MKKIIILFFLFCSLIRAENILIASFNTLRLGESEKDYYSMAKILSKFDIIALQEVMNEQGLNKLKNEIEKQNDEKYSYLISHKAVGSQKYKEYYAYLYKKSKVDSIKELGFYQDGKSKEFIREPHAVFIKSNKFDFVIISAHSIFGKDRVEREIEASRYHRVYKYFKDKTKEEDIILLGDFNLPANDNSFKYFKETYNVKEVLDANKNKTTISDKGLANSYDNIFFDRKKLREFTGRFGRYDYSVNNYEEIRKYISDHLIVFVEFENKGDLDEK